MTAAVRSRMRHRALVERDASGAADGYGGPPAAAWQTHLASLPCWYYLPVGVQGRESERVRERGIVVENLPKMLVPNGTDITELDRVASITDRQGGVITDVVMNVLSVVPRHDHLEVTLRAVS